jgi:hypothetical protein
VILHIGYIYIPAFVYINTFRQIQLIRAGANSIPPGYRDTRRRPRRPFLYPFRILIGNKNISPLIHKNQIRDHLVIVRSNIIPPRRHPVIFIQAARPGGRQNRRPILIPDDLLQRMRRLHQQARPDTMILARAQYSRKSTLPPAEITRKYTKKKKYNSRHSIRRCTRHALCCP